MAKFLHKYPSDSEFKPDYDGEFYHEPWVSLTKGAGKKAYGRVNYNKNPNAVPLTFKMREAGMFIVGEPASSWYGGPEEGDVIHYSINDGPWQDFTYEHPQGSDWGWVPLELSLNSGDTVAFKGYFPDRGCYGDFGIASNNGTAKYDVYGNIMSIVDENRFATMTDFPSNWTESCTFIQFFAGAPVVDAGELILPIKHLPKDGYLLMFASCGYLEKVPALHATHVHAESSLAGMFTGCSSLTEVPEDYLLGIEHVFGENRGYLFIWCGSTMFGYCTSLVTAPILPLIPEFEGNGEAYRQFFKGCESLAHVKSQYPGYGYNPGDPIDATYQFGLTNVAPSGVLEVPATSIPYITNLPSGWTVQAIDE